MAAYLERSSRQSVAGADQQEGGSLMVSVTELELTG
jgi:hypothetical protein